MNHFTIKQIVTTLSLILVLGIFSANAQFPNKDGRWFLRTFSPSGYAYSKDPIVVEKDTTIGEYTYSIMNFEFVRCAFRSDSLKVYAINLFGEFHDEFLIYDFGLQKGDTIQLLQAESYWQEELDTVYYRVFKTEIIEINNQKKKRLELARIYDRTNLSDVWIEDIGSLSSPYYPIFFTEHEIVYEIYCYKEAMTNIYGYCSLTAVEQLDLKQNKCFYVNCTKELIFSYDKVKSFNLEILDVNGKTCYKENCFSGKQLNLSLFRPGIYICLLENGDFNTIYKFAVTE